MHELTVTGRKLQLSESTIRRNPGLFAVARLQDSQRERNQRGQSQDKELAGVKAGLGYRVTIISCRSRLVDEHDNLRSGAKPVVDRITEWLGFDSDGDPRLHWEYGQLKSDTEGTIVKIERI